MFFTTVNIQKDGRINLGTALHEAHDCVALRSRKNVKTIAGSIVQYLPKCKKCCAVTVYKTMKKSHG